MKNTIGFTFLFAVINVSLSISIRELELLNRLYPNGDVPKLLQTSMVTRRIDQVKALSERFSLTSDARTFFNTTGQSLQLLLESMESNKAQINDVYKAYARIVNSMFEVYKVQKVTGVGYINTDYLNVDGRDSFPREELQAMIDAYIGDIEMIRKCEVSLGHPDRVDMEIVDRLKSLSNDVRNYTFYRDDPRGVTESYSVSRKTLDQCLWQLDFLLAQFTTAFINSKV